MMKRQVAMTIVLAVLAATPACWSDPPVGPTGPPVDEKKVLLDSAVYAPNGTLVAFTNAKIFIFDGEHLETPIKEIVLDPLPPYGKPWQYRYSLSADGTVAAVAHQVTPGTADVVVVRIPSGETVASYALAGTSDPENPSTVIGFRLSPHGDRLAVTETFARTTPLAVIDTATGTPLWTADGEKTLPVWSLDGGTLYAVDITFQALRGSQLESYDGATGFQRRTQLSVMVGGLAMMADGTTLAGVASPRSCGIPCALHFAFWSATDGATMAELPFGPNVGTSLGYDGRSLLTCSSTDDVCAIPLFDLGTLIRTLHLYRADGTSVAGMPLSDSSSLALSPDGRFVAAAGFPEDNDDTLRVYRIADGALVTSHDFRSIR